MFMSPERSVNADRRQAKEVHAVFSGGAAREQLGALAADLLGRRDIILDSWRAYGDAAPGRNVGSSLSRAQFNDHIPAVLDCLAQTLEAWPDRPDARAAENEIEKVLDHGMQRWQQGYQLTELIQEWGYLQMCVAAELERYAADHPLLDPSVMPAARLAWAKLCAEGVTGSASQYGRLQQTESAGHVSDLELALSALHDVERSRAEAWRVAAHDLRGSVTVVKGASTLLNEGGAAMPEPIRVEVAGMLSKSVSSLHDMLNDLLSLARLEAGHEQREITAFDAAVLLRFLRRFAVRGHGPRPFSEDGRPGIVAGGGGQTQSSAHSSEPVAQRREVHAARWCVGDVGRGQEPRHRSMDVFGAGYRTGHRRTARRAAGAGDSRRDRSCGRRKRR
jgi:hypothetical protein